MVFPSCARAAPEVWLVVGAMVPIDGGVPIDAFRSEAGAVRLHEGDVVPMSPCGDLLTLGLAASAGGSPHEHIVVTLLKKRTASGCALEVLGVASRPGPVLPTPGTHGTSSIPMPADFRRIDPKDVACGTQLIAVIEGAIGGSQRTVDGLGRSGDCRERTDDMQSPLGIRWLRMPGDAPAL